MFDITRLDAPFGACVRGWEPGRPLDDAETEVLHEALRGHVLLVLRGHRCPTNEEFARLGRSFGELFPGGQLYGLESESRDVLRVSNELDSEGHEVGYAGSGYLPWHSDYTFRARAAKETLLEAMVLPDDGPRTHFANTYSAYEALEPALRERIQDLVGCHDPMAAGRRMPEEARAASLENYGSRLNPNAELPYGGKPVPHAIARVHPESGRTALYVSDFVSGIEGMPDDEALPLIDTLLDHAIRADWTYSHSWQLGDLVIFDTVGTVHSRDDFDREAVRSMRQMSTRLPG